MANNGKFKDRSPLICAAGKSTGIAEETVATTLTEYSLEDRVTAIKHDANIWTEDIFVPPRHLPPINNAAFRGTNTEIREVLNPPVKTRYQELIENLKETTYASYWKKELGKARDSTSGLPAGTIPELVTFGTPLSKEPTVKELVNPPKTPYEVLRDSQVAHDWYKKTHNDYNPSERISRGYRFGTNKTYFILPPLNFYRRYNEHFNTADRFGCRTGYDPRGLGVQCISEWFSIEPFVRAKTLQANFYERKKHQIGEVIAPNHNIDCVPEGHRFGVKTPDPFYGVPELIKDPSVPPCLFKQDYYTWLGSLNKIKLKMKQRSNEDFNFDDFYKSALYFDKEKTGWLPIDLFYEVCACYRFTFPKDEIESLMKVLNVIRDDQIDYKRFIDLINSNKPPLEVTEFNDIPNENKYYLTTNQAASCDHLVMDNSRMPDAGVPSIRFDLEKPVTPFGGCRADIEHLGDYTSARALLNPSIYTNYGLTYRDFYVPRSAKTIRSLFEKVGYNFPGDSFEKLWKAGVELDKTGLVCVDTFKNLLQIHCPRPKIAVDEQDCEKKIQ